jgi:hypothetical protein
MISGEVALQRFKDIDYEETDAIKRLLADSPKIYEKLSMPENPMEFLMFKGSEAKPRPSLATMFVMTRTMRLNNKIRSPHETMVALHSELGQMAGIVQDDNPLRSRFLSIGMGGCPSAEDFFVDTASQILADEDRNQASIQVFHDKEGSPVFLKKHFDEPNALSLKPLSIEGLYMPPGSLVAVDPRHSKRATGKQSVTLNPQETYQYSTHVISEPMSIAPLRITPWAYEAEIDRVLFACRINPSTDIAEYDQSRAERIETYRLEDFERAAKSVLSVCGIA